MYAREDNLTEAESATSSAYLRSPGKVLAMSSTRFVAVLCPPNISRTKRHGNHHRTIRRPSCITQSNAHSNRRGIRRRRHAQSTSIRQHRRNKRIRRDQFASASNPAGRTTDRGTVKQRQKEVEARAASKQRDQEIARLNSAEASLRDLQSRAHQLRHDVEVRVKNPNTELKPLLSSAPPNSNLSRKARKLSSRSSRRIGTEWKLRRDSGDGSVRTR